MRSVPRQVHVQCCTMSKVIFLRSFNFLLLDPVLIVSTSFQQQALGCFYYVHVLMMNVHLCQFNFCLVWLLRVTDLSLYSTDSTCITGRCSVEHGSYRCVFFNYMVMHLIFHALKNTANHRPELLLCIIRRTTWHCMVCNRQYSTLLSSH